MRQVMCVGEFGASVFFHHGTGSNVPRYRPAAVCRLYRAWNCMEKCAGYWPL